jgi:DNA repair protein SbcC/Rad50
VIPRRIKLKAFLCYKEEQEIDFDSATSLWMLSGLNGSGKSAIFDAVTYALFGHHRGGGQQVLELINKDSDSLVVEFDFLLDSRTYKIKRTVKRRANNTAASTQQIFVLEANTGKWQAVEGTENKRDGFDPWVADHVGLDYETFTASVLLLQGKAEKLLDSKPEGRRSVLAKIVDLERYERLFRAADDRRKALEAELKTLTNHLETLPETQPLQLEEVRRRIVNAEAAREASRREVERMQGLEFEARGWLELQGRLRQATERVQRSRQVLSNAAVIETNLRRLEELREVLPRMQTIVTQAGVIHGAETQIKTLGVQRDTFIKQHKTLESQLKQTRDKRIQAQHVIETEEKRQQDVVARYRESTARMEKLKEFERHQGELQRLLAEVGRLPVDPLGKVLAARAELDELTAVGQTVPLLQRFQARRDELRQALERCKVSKERLEYLQGHGKQCSDDVEQLKTRLDSAGRESQQANEQATEARTVVKHAKESLNDLNTLDGASKVCRACGQPITPGHVQEERKRRSNAVKEAETHLKPALERQHQALAVEQNERAQLEKAQRNLQEAREEYRAHQAENKQSLADVDRLQKECAQAYGELPETMRQQIGAGPGLDWPTTGYPTDSDLQTLRSRANGVTTARQLLQKAEQTLQQWQHLKTLETSTAATLLRLQSELPTDPQEVRRKHTDLELEEQTLKKNLDARRGEFKGIEKELERISKERDQAREQIDLASGKIRDQELAAQHAHDAVVSNQKQLPPVWLPLSVKVGSRELFDWKKEQTELEDLQTDKRGKELKEARLNLDLLQQEKTKLEAEAERFAPEARVDPATIQALLAESRRADQSCEKLLLEAQRELGLLETQQQQREKLQQQYLEKDGERNVQKLLAELLGRDRLQLYLVRQAERQVVEYANAVLDRLSGGLLYLRLSGEAEGEGSTARALELEAYNRSTGDKPINVAFLSGSQKFRVAVSLALGIGQYASRQHRPIESVIIDEGFGCLDRQGRQVMIQELHNLRGQMRCILLVSHQEEFADAFSDGYHFELHNGATQVTRVQK